jgi:hypothetical protein
MIFKISYVIKTALIFFLIYDIGFSFAQSITSGRFVFLGLCLFYFFRYKNFRVNKDAFLFFAVLLILNIVAIFQFINSDDFKQSSRLIWFTIYSIITPFLLLKIFKDKIDFLNAFFIATTIQSIITIGSFLNPEFKQFILSAIVVGGNDIKDGFRAIGFTSASGAAFSVIQFCGVFSGLMLLKYTRDNLIKSIFILIFIVIGLLSTLIIGRTGLLCSIIAIIYFLLINFNLKKVILYSVITFIISQINFINLLENQTEGIDGFNIEFFKNWIEDGFILKNNNTVEAISRMPIPPLSLNTIVGTGEVFDAEKSVNASGHDSGYIQTYFSLGFVFAIVFYVSYFLFLIRITKLKNLLILLFLIFILFVVEFKEPFIFKYILPFYILTLTVLYDKERNVLLLNK